LRALVLRLAAAGRPPEPPEDEAEAALEERVRVLVRGFAAGRLAAPDLDEVDFEAVDFEAVDFEAEDFDPDDFDPDDFEAADFEAADRDADGFGFGFGFDALDLDADGLEADGRAGVDGFAAPEDLPSPGRCSSDARRRASESTSERRARTSSSTRMSSKLSRMR